MAVPRTPEAFFGSYLPIRLGKVSDGLAGKSSPGSIVFLIGQSQVWCVRLRDGSFEFTPADADDAIVRVSLDPASFEPLFVRSAERDELAGGNPEQRLRVIRALATDPSRANLVRTAAGAVAIVVSEGDREHRVTITPGAREPGDATCTLRLGMGELVDLQAGRAQPLQLMMTGQLVIQGDAQIVMSLAASLAG